MNIGNKSYAGFRIYRNPQTDEYATLFIHNIKYVIVTNDMTISTNNMAYTLLNNLGFTQFVAESN